jgi:PAS domain S-box-containing protein
MKKLLDELYDEIQNIKSFEDFQEKLPSINLKIKKAKEFESRLSFQITKYVKDKNVLHSLLAKTSEDLRKTNQQLKLRADELDILLNTIPALVFFKDLDHRYVIVNNAFIDFAGIPLNKIIGKRLKDLNIQYDHHDNYIENEKQVLRMGIPIYNITERLKKDNKFIWLNTNLASVKNPEGKIIGLIGVSWDITPTKEYEEQLKKAKELAEEGTKAKSLFLANVSHEIRTPMNGIIGMTQILLNTKLTKKQKEILDLIISSSDNLLALINDILDFSKIEADKLTFVEKDFELNKPFKDVQRILSVKAEEKSLKLTLNLNKNLPKYVRGDEYRLKQVIFNLATNAVKFTDKGFIRINVDYYGKIGKKYNIKITVEDTGIGIADDKKDLLFKSFSQIDSSSTKEYSGTGLGLAISKHLVEMMEGEIGVESKVGKGSKFWFTIKLKPAENINKTKKSNNVNTSFLKSKGKIKVLLVEDNYVNQKIAIISLKSVGFNVEIAFNGKDAVEQFKKNKYDVILMDVQMPVMNGYDATKEIRAIEKQKNLPRTPIIALTANAMKEDEEKCLNAGMDNFLSKPFKPLKLIELLDKII